VRTTILNIIRLNNEQFYYSNIRIIHCWNNTPTVNGDISVLTFSNAVNLFFSSFLPDYLCSVRVRRRRPDPWSLRPHHLGPAVQALRVSGGGNAQRRRRMSRKTLSHRTGKTARRTQEGALSTICSSQDHSCYM
jgi:hypothetical protein